MTKYYVTLFLLLSALFVFSSCRPKDLEGAFVDYNAGRFDQALVLAEKVTKEHPQNSEGWYLLGELYGKKDRIPEMVDAFDKSLAIDQTHKAKIDFASQNFFSKKFNSGVVNYNGYLKLEDKESEKAVKKMDQAIQDFMDANSIKKDFRALSLVGQSYNITGRRDEAFKTYQTLTTEFADSSSSWASLGKYYFEEKEYQMSIDNFKKALEKDAMNGEAAVYIATCYDLLEMPSEAIDAYTKAIELSPEDSAIPFNLGLLYYKGSIAKDVKAEDKDKMLADAILYLGKSLEINPDYQACYQLKGNAELLLKKYEDAKNTLESGVERFPEDAQMWGDLSICYTWLNDKEKAEAAKLKADELGN